LQIEQDSPATGGILKTIRHFIIYTGGSTSWQSPESGVHCVSCPRLGNLDMVNWDHLQIGQIASKMWREIPVHFLCIDLDAAVVMPDHIHGIIVINRSIRTSIVGALHATPLLHHESTLLLPHDTAHLADKTMSSISLKSGSLSIVVRSFK